MLAAVTTASGSGRTSALRVVGDPAATDAFCRLQADVVDAPVERPASVDTATTTALGAAALAALATGVPASVDDLGPLWRPGRSFGPASRPPGPEPA